MRGFQSPALNDGCFTRHCANALRPCATRSMLASLGAGRRVLGSLSLWRPTQTVPSCLSLPL